MSPSELEILEKYSGWSASQPESTNAGVGEIAARSAANLPSRGLSSMMESINALAYAGASKEDRPSPWSIPDLVEPPVVTDSSTTAQKVADVVGGSVAPEIAALLVPYLGISKLAKVAGAGEVMSTVMGNLGQGVLGGIKESPQEAARFGLVGAALSPISAVSGLTKRLAMGIPIAAADYGLIKMQGGSAGQAATGAAVDVLSTVIPMKAKTAHTINPALAKAEQLKGLQREIASISRELNPTVQKQAYIDQLNAEIANLQTQTGLTPETAANLNLQEQFLGHKARSAGEESLASPTSPAQPKAPVNPLRGYISPLNKPPQSPIPSIFQPVSKETAILHQVTEAQPPYLRPAEQVIGNLTGSQFDTGTPVGDAFANVPREADVGMQKLAAMIGPQRAKGKLSVLPEFMRTQGGFTSDDSEVLKTLLSSGLGGIAGAGIGGAVTGTEEGMGAGAVLGLAAPWGLKALKMGRPLHEGIVPAIKIEGQIIRGLKGETHQDILQRFIKQNPHKEAEALVGFDTKANPNFFLKGDVPITRKELFDTLGVSDSQGLASLQNEGTSFPKGEAGSIPAGGKGKYEQNQKGLNKFAKDIEDRVTETIKKIPRTDLQRGDTVWLPSGRRAEFVSDSIPDKKTSRRRVIVKYTIGNGDEVTTHAWLDTVTLENPRPPIAKQNEIASLQKGNIEMNNAQPQFVTPVEKSATPTGAYHYGDLGVGRDTTKERMSSGRSTGHFGTGTYFLGERGKTNIELPSDIQSRTSRGSINIKTEGLNLFQAKDPQALHEFLRDINGLIYRDTKLYQDKIAKPSFLTDLYRKGESLGFKREEIDSAIAAAKNVFPDKADPRTPSTVFMQKLGYDGIDSRNSIFDNTDYGSVIFVKPTMQKGTNDTVGTITRELVLPIAGAAIGAAAGYAEKGPEGALAGAIIGGTLGIFAGRGIDSLERIAPALATPAKGTFQTGKNIGQQSFKRVQKALNQPVKDLAGEDVYGRGGILSKLFRIMENQFQLHQPDALHTIITRARGFPSEIIDRVNNSLQQLVKYHPPAEVSKLANAFLDGSLISPREELTFLQANGAIDEAAYRKLNRVQKGNYDIWSVRNTDPQGNVTINKWYTNTPIRKSFLELQEKALLQQMPEDWRVFANLQIAARRGITQFQQIISTALPPGQLKDKIDDSLGRYIPRMYRMFTDPKYTPTNEQIHGAMKEFGLSRAQREIDDAVATSKANTAEEHNRKIAAYSQSSSLQSTERLAKLQTFVPTEVNGQKFFASPEIGETLKKFSNEDFLRMEIHSYLSDLKASRQAIGGGKAIDKTLFVERQDIGPSFRDMLGEYTDPVERIAMGAQKMYSPSQAAKLVTMLKGMEVDGIPMAMSADTWSASNTALKEAMTKTTNLTEIANLQIQLNRLNAYKKLPTDIRFGEYAGLYTNRFVADYFTDDNRIWETSLGRHMAGFNRLFKTFHIPLNPVSQLRQIVSMPLFAAIGRATPAAMGQAWRAYKNVSPAMRSEMLREGVWTADFIRGELTDSVETVMSGKYDSTLVKTLKGGVKAALEAYRVPDMLVRGATYIAAKNRIALELGKELTDPEVVQRAVQWTDRYTMNYDNISKFVRGARNIPFVNPFVSFQAEMLRIMKNFVVDSAKGNVERLATFSGLLSLPYMLSATAEGSLSEKDRKEWLRAKNMLPPYMREQSLLPIAKLQNGKFKYVAISSVIPQDNFQQAVQALGKGDMEAFATVNPFLSRNSSPLFNMISELVTGEDKQTGLKFRSNKEALANVISDYLPPLAPGGYEWQKLANVNVENLKSGRVENWGDIALRYTTGLSAGVIKPDSVLASAKGKLKRDIADLRQHFTRISNTTKPDSDKHEAYQEYQDGVHTLIQEFAERYGTVDQVRTSSN